MSIQGELWTDGWIDEADEQAARDLHAEPEWPLAEHGRSCSRTQIPNHRAVDDVLETL
ncbi:hypothetical protein [Streptomyces gardneri]|uniref:hypothetical protein n=1 Tax=Streptomyces gardneri TaxID=66892 RepID=UPI0035D9E017